MQRVLILGAAEAKPGEPPLWITEHAGTILIEHIARCCAPLAARLVFVMQKLEARRHHLAGIVQIAAPNSAVIEIDGKTQGAACTALLCINEIDPDDELVIMNANEIIDVDLGAVAGDFRSRNLDAGVTTFPSLHPRYSYVLLDDKGFVIQAAEKHPISRSAIAGFFWFKRGSDFISAVQNMIRKDAKVDGQFFVSLTLNEMVLKQKVIGTYPLNASSYRPLKSIQQVSNYEMGA
jgi:hypothetical protein